jgi:opacity protein-like surface antigen
MKNKREISLMKKLVLAAASIAALGATVSAMAAVSLPSGWYLEGNAGATRVSNSNYGSGLSTSNSGLGWNANGGYKFMPYFAGELGYTRYANTKLKYAGTQVAKVTNYSYYLAGKGILPISDSGFELFAKLGIARLKSHATLTNASYASSNNLSINTGSRTITAAYFGVGGEYNFTPMLAMNIQWNRSKGNSTSGNLDLLSLGLSYLFG